MSDDRLNRAQELRAAGVPARDIAVVLGVCRETIYRWLDPEYAERCRAHSRMAKQRRTRPCATSGCRNIAKYAGHGGDGVATYCQSCNGLIRADRNKALAYTRDEIVAAFQRFAESHGRAPKVVDFQGKGMSPSADTVYRRFPSWDAALLAAGLPARRYNAARRDYFRSASAA